MAAPEICCGVHKLPAHGFEDQPLPGNGQPWPFPVPMHWTMETNMFTHDAIIIEAQDRATRDLQLERAVSVLSDKATDRGIRITRHSFGSFTATLSSDVEYGLIQELDLV